MANKGSFTPGDPRAGRPPGRANNATLEIRQFCRSLLSDPKYRDSLKKRLIEGRLGAMELELWNRAYGPAPVRPLDAIGELIEDLGANGGNPVV